MVIGIVRLEFRLHGNESLKGKRSVANSLKQKIRNRFNVSVSEVAHQDVRDYLALAAVTVAPDQPGAERRLSKLLLMVEDVCHEDLVEVSTEFFHES
jgi:hypothetical protein